MRNRRAAPSISLTLAVATIAFTFFQSPSPRAAAGAPQVPQELRERAQREQRVRVIVELNLSEPFNPEAVLPNAAAVLRQRQAITAVGARILAKLPRDGHRVLHRYLTSPQLALEVGPAALAALEAAGSDIVKVTVDEILHPVLAESVPLIQGDQIWAAGYDGSGTTIAILDTGVDSTHPFLAGKVVEEACYSSSVPGESQSVCPNGLTVQIGPGAAAPCPLSDCFHGTHVAGIAAGDGVSAGQSFSGVAKGAQLMAVQVFSEVTDPVSCGGIAPCMGGYSSDVIAGLERVYTVAWQRNIASVNMSLGGAQFTAPCDSEPYKPIIDNLRAIGIATVVASGNSGSMMSISSPACVSSAVSVGSTTKTDTVSWFSNVAPFLSLFAPGESITSSVPGGGYMALSGTSMAAPHVAGTFALLRQAAPTASVTAILQALQQTGRPIVDSRLFGTTTIPRVNAFEALATLVPVTSPCPVITSLSPTRARAGVGFTLTITGSGFNAFSVAQWNGTARPTTVVSTTQIRASISAGDVPAVGTAQVTVFTPEPGGGTTSALTFTIDPPPVLTISAPTVMPGGTETVTLANGVGGASDWLALAATGSPNTSYLKWTYVGAGITARTWTVTLPTTGGPFEFRLFLNNGYTRAATSPPVTIDPTFSPVPVATSLSPASAVVGSAAFTLTVNGSGFVASSVVRWNGANRSTTFVSGNQLRAAIDAGDLAAVGTAPVTVFTPSPGGGTSSSLPFVIRTTPTLAVSATAVAGGSSVTVTLANGVGGSTDWFALAATSAPNTSYLQWTYVGAGVTTRTWTVTLPATGGPFEFRLFLNDGYTRAATSPAITLLPGAAVLTSLSPVSAVVGGAAFTLTVNGSGFAASSVVRWNGADRPTTFMSANQLRAAIGAGDLAATGTVQVAVFSPPPGGGVSASLPFAIGLTPSLAVSATTVTGGGSVTVTLTSGMGGSSDWLALAAASAPNTSYLQWTYVGAGVTTRTWTVALPTTGGPFEFRLFLNGGYTRAATSPPVTITPPLVPPSLAVSATTAAPGSSVTVTLANGLGGSLDWLAFSTASSSNTSRLTWTYVGAGVTTRTWTVTLPMTGGPFEFRLFLNDGYTRAATSPAITLSP